MRLEQLEDFGFGQVEAEGFEGDFELVVVDSLVFVEVEERELWGGGDVSYPSIQLCKCTHKNVMFSGRYYYRSCWGLLKGRFRCGKMWFSYRFPYFLPLLLA